MYKRNGWKGEKYDSNLRVTDIAALFRAYAKKNWPGCKFSVRTTHNSINIALMSGPFNPWNDLSEPHIASEIEHRKLNFPGYEPRDGRKYGTMFINDQHIENHLEITDDTKTIFKDIRNFLNLYNYDYSDSQSDYFNTNFYLDFYIGRTGKPFIQKTF